MLPEGFLHSDVPERTKAALNALLVEFNERYAELLERNDFSDNVFATFTVESL
jgi:hypothetical protein